MRPIFAAWRPLSSRLKAAPARLFVFDVDGVLAPLAPTPSAARVSASMRRALRALSARPRTTVGIISGRSLKNTEQKVGVKGLMYSGNHGLEIKGPRVHFAHPAANRLNRSFVKLVPVLKKAFKPVPGVLVETKGLTGSVHYRAVPRIHRNRFWKAAEEVEPMLRKRGFAYHDGHEVLEVRPQNVKWDKGAALWFIRNHLHPTPATVYVGDDVTDEAAFKRSDIGVRVGRLNGSRANYYLRSQRAVERFLEKLRRV
jgi:trehalose 6-phosphate phosphatase